MTRKFTILAIILITIFNLNMIVTNANPITITDLKITNIKKINENIYYFNDYNNKTIMIFTKNNKTIIYENGNKIMFNYTLLDVSIPKSNPSLVYLLFEDNIIIKYDLKHNKYTNINIIKNPFIILTNIEVSENLEIIVSGAVLSSTKKMQNYLALISEEGLIWERNWGGSGNDYILHLDASVSLICCVDNHNILYCYDYSGNSLFNKSFGDILLLKIYDQYVYITAYQNEDIYLYRLDVNGNIMWAQNITPIIPESLLKDTVSNEVILIGIVKLSGMFYPILLLINDENGSIIGSNIINVSCTSPLKIFHFDKIRMKLLVYWQCRDELQRAEFSINTSDTTGTLGANVEQEAFDPLDLIIIIDIILIIVLIYIYYSRISKL